MDVMDVMDDHDTDQSPMQGGTSDAEFLPSAATAADAADAVGARRPAPDRRTWPFPSATSRHGLTFTHPPTLAAVLTKR